MNPYNNMKPYTIYESQIEYWKNRCKYLERLLAAYTKETGPIEVSDIAFLGINPDAMPKMVSHKKESTRSRVIYFEP